MSPGSGPGPLKARWVPLPSPGSDGTEPVPQHRRGPWAASRRWIGTGSDQRFYWHPIPIPGDEGCKGPDPALAVRPAGLTRAHITQPPPPQPAQARVLPGTQPQPCSPPRPWPQSPCPAHQPGFRFATGSGTSTDQRAHPQRKQLGTAPAIPLPPCLSPFPLHFAMLVLPP